MRMKYLYPEVQPACQRGRASEAEKTDILARLGGIMPKRQSQAPEPGPVDPSGPAAVASAHHDPSQG